MSGLGHTSSANKQYNVELFAFTSEALQQKQQQFAKFHPKINLIKKIKFNFFRFHLTTHLLAIKMKTKIKPNIIIFFFNETFELLFTILIYYGLYSRKKNY